MKDGAREPFGRSVSSCLIAGILVIAAICLSVSRAHAEVWKNVTVISATGWKYVDVTVENVAGDSAIVIVSDDGARERASFSNIRVIRDQRGKDITALVLSYSAESSEGATAYDGASIGQGLPPVSAASAIAPQAPDESRISRRPRESRREKEAFYGKRFNVMLAGGAGYGIPLGEWFEGMTAGFGGGAALRLAVADNFYIGFSYKRQWLGIEKSYEILCFYDEYYIDYQCIPVEWDIHLDEFYLAFGWMSPVSSYRTPFAYAEVGMGFVKHAITLSASVEDETASSETDETKFGMLFDAGVIFPFSDRIGLNVEADMRLTGEFDSSYNTYDPYGTNYSGNNGFLLGFKIGLVAMLGGGE